MDLSGLKILEIGDHHHFKLTLPQQTTLLWTGYRPPRYLTDSDYFDCTPRRFRHAVRAARNKRYDLVIAYSRSRAPWHPRYWARSIAQTPSKPFAALSRVFGVSMLRHAQFDTPLAVIDMHDSPTIDSCNFFLLDRAKVFLKRELPVDCWQTLHGSGHPGLPTLRVRRSARWRERIAKLQPISLQAGRIVAGAADEVFAAKTNDVFFAGSVADNSTLRTSGARELQCLAEQGVRIDMPRERLPADEYLRRMSRAWLTWSPAGLGWDCYRHYEAPQCLSVPIINYPTILRYQPLEDGVHAYFYAPEPGGLGRAIRNALLDKDKLRQMAVAGRAHVLQYHVGPAFCARVVEAVLRDE